MSAGPQNQGVWNNFFRSLSPEQQSLYNEASTASSATTPQSTSSAATSPLLVEQTMLPRPQAKSADAQKATRVAGRRRQTSKKRPLNAFIAYRTYYSPQLSGLTQKVKSGHVQRMWAGEPRKNLWSLLAKAYTDLRDNHEESVPLDKFLAIAVTKIPVIPSTDYLVKYGWELTTDEQGEKTLMQTNFDAAALDVEYPAQTLMSVPDLVDHCYKVGLLQRSARVGRIATVTFATTSAQAAPTPAQNRIFDIEQELTQLLEAQNAPAAVSSPEFDFNTMSVDFRSEYRPTINAVTRDQQNAFQSTPMALHFHPQIQPPVLGFDPNMIQDDFDPFSLDANVDDFLDLSG